MARIRVTVRVCGHVAGPDERCDGLFQLDPGATVDTLIHELGLNGVDGILVVINGQMANPWDPLEDGAMVSVFPRATGG